MICLHRREHHDLAMVASFEKGSVAVSVFAVATATYLNDYEALLTACHPSLILFGLSSEDLVPVGGPASLSQQVAPPG